jgi:hypothetical protein
MEKVEKTFFENGNNIAAMQFWNQMKKDPGLINMLINDAQKFKSADVQTPVSKIKPGQ